MLKNNRNKKQTSFMAEVFMCQHYSQEGLLGYWELRLLYGNTLIRAFHLDESGQLVFNYKANDEVFVAGQWIHLSKTRFQILSANISMRYAANDATYLLSEQLEFDFGDG